MRSLLFALLASVLPSVAAAQTLGTTGINDYWITPGGTPGGLSCKPLTLVTPLTMTMNTSCTPGLVFVISWSTCACVACAPFPPIGIAPCLAGPTSACPASNQFLESSLFSPCITFQIVGQTNTAGGGVIPINVPPVGPSVTLSTQAFFFGPAGCPPPPFGLLMSQAWNVTFI